MLLVHANEATATYRRVFFDLRDATDGVTPETGETGGQPQISTNGGAFGDTGIGTLTHMGNGRYYAELTQAAVATAGAVLETRYKSANTIESPGTSVQVVALSLRDSTSAAVALLDLADAVETGLTPRQALRLITAILGGKVSGGGTTSIIFRNAVADNKERVTATVDGSYGNRNAITADLT